MAGDPAIGAELAADVVWFAARENVGADCLPFGLTPTL
jgi:hypothetical protein